MSTGESVPLLEQLKLKIIINSLFSQANGCFSDLGHGGMQQVAAAAYHDSAPERNT